jgi:ATP-dependent DNA helicase RecG
MIIDDKMLNGTLFETVEDAMRFIFAQIKVAFEIKGMPTRPCVSISMKSQTDF